MSVDPSGFDTALSDSASQVLSHMDAGESGPFASANAVAVDPALVVTIIQTIISLIQGCKNQSSAQLRTKASEPGLLTRLAVKRAASDAVRRNFGARSEIGWAEFNALKEEIADGVLSAASDADDAAIEEVRTAALNYRGD